MMPFQRKRVTVGLDIGSKLIKVAVIDHTNKTPELVKVVVSPLLADAIVEGEVMDPTIVADTIRSTLEAAGVKKREVVTAVGGRDVIVKRIQTERARESEAREVIEYEAQQHVPFDDMESVEIDFQILDSESTDGKMDVLLVAAKRDLVEARLRLLADAGLEPSVVDVDAFALHNAFEASHPDAMHGVVALVNIGHEVTNVNILDDGVPVLTRDMAVGTRRIREDLQREIGMSADDAEAVIQGYERSPHLDRVLGVRLEDIVGGVERAAGFLLTSSHSSSRTLRAVFTCGGGSRMRGVNEILAERLGTPVQQANPLSGISVRQGALDSLIIEECAPLLMLPIGLALRN
jgi:type IV pilus assembly protein PilM